MQDQYNPLAIEEKWQQFWDKDTTFYANNFDSRPKYYALVEFPYPSGDGLHVGHPRSYTALDIVARKKRLQGFNVLYSIGWDAFGLPTENFAIKHQIHPKRVTEKNVARFKEQLKSLGFSFDWSREINTTDPEYYRWTQWIFIKLFQAGLAYKAEIPINWCTSCKVGLANEEVVEGACERCGGTVERKIKNQWMLKITDYADKLIQDLELVDYIERAKIQQINWIGPSQGVELSFHLKGNQGEIKVFTTRPDTLYGATYLVLAPEHPLIEELKEQINNFHEVRSYREAASRKSDLERSELSKNKTGVLLEGIKGIHPITGKEISIWISDYVLMTYGTGGIMAVPAHDQRDWEFAKKYQLPIIEVIQGGNIEAEAYTGDGILVNSGFLNGLSVHEAKDRMTQWLVEQNLGKRKVNYKLRDWVFSRQRYWGEPIPLVYCNHCGWVAVPEDQLPLKLPEVDQFIPTDNGESPLANLEEWLNTPCPKCGEPGKRETDTMPQWAGSSWYFLRYTDPQNEVSLASKEALEYWLPVDWYNGGMEHTTLHLLYSRFWHKFLYDIGVVPTSEPYQKRTSHGMILAENNEKMSKSRGNVVNPDEIVREFGADTFRIYEMFIGDFEKSVNWSQNGLKGCRRFLERVWRLQDILIQVEDYSTELEVKIHQTIKKVSEDYEALKFNTAIASLMALINEFYQRGRITRGELRTFLILLNPPAPHITEELWTLLGFDHYLHQQDWPQWEEGKTKEDTTELVIQINGKLKGKLYLSVNTPREEVRKRVFEVAAVQQLIVEKEIVKEIFVPGKIYNIVLKN